MSGHSGVWIICTTSSIPDAEPNSSIIRGKRPPNCRVLASSGILGTGSHCQDRHQSQASWIQKSRGSAWVMKGSDSLEKFHQFRPAVLLLELIICKLYARLLTSLDADKVLIDGWVAC
jgi:uncharacterized protein (UPF0548 family)